MGDDTQTNNGQVSAATRVFRPVYRELTDTEKVLVASIKETAADLFGFLNQIKTEESGREVALAKTKLEEAVMWAVKGLTK